MLNTKVSATKYNDNAQDIATTTKGPKSTNYASLFKNKIFMLCGSCFWSTMINLIDVLSVMKL
jgi:hypothetical protein